MRRSHKMGWSNRLYNRTVSILGSRYFFYGVLGLFVIEAGWLAITGLYPMAYDENFHLGLIRLYADRLLPFWSQQPEGPAIFGTVARDPSYLYHYLMSFPYRWLVHFVHTEMAQVIWLRFINVGLFAVGISLYRRLLLRTGASRALVHSVLAVFVLTPTIPFLASQINYDNAFFALSGLLLLLALKSLAGIKEHKIPFEYLWWLAVVGLFASLVKYPFVPLLLAVGLWVGMALIINGRQIGWTKMGRQTTDWLKATRRLKKILLVGSALLLIGLSAERYGINIVRYHSPLPACEKVLNIDRCMAYPPWRRNYSTYRDKVAGRLVPSPLVLPQTDPLHYSRLWFKLLSRQLFYALNGEASHFKSQPPLPLARNISLTVGMAGLAMFILWQRRLRRNYQLGLLVFAGFVYSLVLWGRNYTDFHHLGVAYAIQARYLVPVLPVIYLLIGLGWARTLRKLPQLKALLVVLVISALLLEGGGAIVFIVRSDPTWYWPKPSVIRLNQSAQQLLKKLVVGE